MLAALLVAALAARAAEPVKNPDTFVLAETEDLSSLDPAIPYDGASQSLIQNVYETLIGFSGSSLSRFEPRLAERVPTRENGLISPDGRTYRFRMRRGARFQDGTEVSAEDARYSLLRFMIEDPNGGPAALLLEPVAGAPSTRSSSGTITLDFDALARRVRVEGRDLVVELPRPYAPFLSVMARWSYVLPKAWCAAHGDWDGRAETWTRFNDPPRERSYLFDHMNGAGPFKLERWDRVQRYALLARNDDYWRGPAKLRRVLVKTVADLNARRLMLQAGDADLVDTPRPYVAQFAAIPGVRVVDGLPRLQTDPALFFTVAIDSAGNPDIGSGKLDGDGIPPDFFADPDVRKAFAYSFDDEALRRDTYRGTAARAIGPIPPGVPGYDPAAPHYDYDPKKAEALFRRARGGALWEKGFKFTLTYHVGGEVREAAARILKSGVERLNPRFRVDLRGVEWASFVDKAQRRLMPLFVRGWMADYPDAHNFVYAFYHSRGRYPSAQGFSDAGLDAMIEAAVAEPTPAKREALYKKILARGYDDCPAIFTVHPAGVFAMREWVRGFVDNPVNLGVYYYPIEKK
jgi:peptide/nickel transport system substrate-binding protein